MTSQFAMYLTWWGPYVIGILAICYAIIMRAPESAVHESPEDRPPLPIIFLTVAALTIGAILIGILAKPSDLSWRFGVVFLIGGIVGLASCAHSHWRAGSPFACTSSSFFGIGLALLEMALLRNHFREAPMVYLFVAALGTWFVAAISYYANPTRFVVGSRSAALAAAAIAACVALGVFHYSKSATGSLFAIDICALTILLALLGSLITMATRKTGAWAAIIGSIVFLGLTGWLGYMLSVFVIQSGAGGLCAFVGAATILLGYVTLRASGILGRTQAGALIVLLTLACAALSMRWLGGYGAALASLGALAAVPFVFLISDLTPDREAPVPTLGIAIVASLAAIGFVRIFAENTRGSATSIRIFESYVIAGLILGGVLVLMQASLARSWQRDASPIASFVRGFITIVFGFGLILASAYFWRYEAMVGLVLGGAVGLFYSIYMQTTSDSTQSADISIGIPLFAVTVLPAFLDATLNLTRDAKISAMLWTLGAVAVLIIVMSITRLTHRRPEVGVG